MKMHLSGFSTFISGCALIVSGMAYSEQTAVNPDFAYFYHGDTPGGWQWVLADPGNWWMPLEGNEGVSGREKLTMTASDSPEFPGAIKLAWKRTSESTKGDAIITGRTIDLSAYEHVAELVVALKLDSHAAKSVYVKMLCGDKCEAQVSIHDHLKKMGQKEWFALPIPLDCFVAQGADLENITSPFTISTTGEMVLHIAEISIGRMAEGDEGCETNNETPPSDSE